MGANALKAKWQEPDEKLLGQKSPDSLVVWLLKAVKLPASHEGLVCAEVEDSWEDTTALFALAADHLIEKELL